MAAGSKRRWVLEVADGGATTELPRAGVLTIGSAEQAHWQLQSDGLADVHCAIGRIKGGGWAIKDLGSKSGTRVNGEPVQSRRLQVGDKIVLGSLELAVLDHGAPAQARPAAKESPAPTEPAKPATRGGLHIEGYRIERPLGRGGMGEVFLAVQESLDRRVALKLLSNRLSGDGEFVSKFQSEARAAAALSHPNVVVVHDVGASAGLYYLSMEYMERGNLESRLARIGKLPWREVLDVLHGAAAGLVYAELKGIVHRDIKPANLMQDGVGTTKIADLGLALHLEAEAQESDNKKIFGTPHFISPEQARGERVDARSDLYSLGATAYRLISGRTPFEGQTTRDILRGHFTERPKPLRELVADVPPELEGVVERLLEKAPEDRFASAAELLKEVDRLRSHAEHGVGAQRSKLPLLLAVAIFAVVAGGAWFALQAGSGGRDAASSGALATAGSPENGTRGLDAQSGAAPGPQFVDPPDLEGGEPKDDDTALAQLEVRAENAYLKVPVEYTEEERRDELLALAAQFAGTAQARAMGAEAQEIAQRLETRAGAVEARQAAVRSLLANLQRAAEERAEVPAPAARLQRMLAVERQDEFAADAEYQTQRQAIYRAAVEDAWNGARAYVVAADARAHESGDFDALGAALAALSEGLVLPLLPTELVPADAPGLRELGELAERVPLRIAGLDAERVRFGATRRLEESRALARGLGGPTGLEAELRAWDIAAARKRLTDLAGRMSSEEVRALLDEWLDGLAAAEQAIGSISTGFSSWRRKTVRDPRASGSRFRDALAVDAQGLTLDVDGQAERVPWSDFGAHPSALNQLFLERLERSYSARETEGIVMLLRIATAMSTLDLALPHLAGGGPIRFEARDAANLVEAFGDLDAWGADAALQRERDAGHGLARVLEKAGSGAWSSSVAATEMLLGQYADTLLVRLLSDGTLLLPTPESPVDTGDAQVANGAPGQD